MATLKILGAGPFSDRGRGQAGFCGNGHRLIGPLPAEVQNYTSYTAAPMTAASNKEVAQAFVHFLGAPSGKALFVAAGIE